MFVYVHVYMNTCAVNAWEGSEMTDGFFMALCERGSVSAAVETGQLSE